MDPNACLVALLDAFRDGDREAAWEHLENLNDWLAKGGFMPSDPRITRLPAATAHGLGPDTIGDLIYRQHGVADPIPVRKKDTPKD